MKYTRISLFSLLLFSAIAAGAQGDYVMRIGLLKYSGGGDWYANPTSLPNLIDFVNKELKTSINPDYQTIEVGSSEIFNLPFVHMTGHGNVFFTPRDVDNLRNYLIGGGFLHIDDNYGMDSYVRREMKKVFPDLDFMELPNDHEIYNQRFPFPKGLPKIHEHDNKPAKGYGIFYQGRMVCFYTYETDLGDGWEDNEIHNNPEEVRRKALQMGANLINYVFTH